MITNRVKQLVSLSEKSGGFCRLLTRFVLGWVFLQSGWGKWGHIDGVIQFFTSLNIPFPQIQAPFVAGFEMVGGAFLLVGFATRLITLPLMVIMVVAIITAKREDLSDLSSLLGLSEFLYIVLLLWLFSQGPGVISLDGLIKKRLKGQR